MLLHIHRYDGCVCSDNHILSLFCARAINGVTLYVLGFAVGPALWAPLSEIFARRIVFVTTMGVTTVLVNATAASQDAASVLTFRFLSGMFGASTLINGGGNITDMFPISKAEAPMTYYMAAPFLGPVVSFQRPVCLQVSC